MSDEQSQGISRRAFLARVGKAGAAAAAVCAGGYLLWTDRVETGDREAIRSLGDFSVGDDGPKMAILRGADRRKTVSAALDALGGIDRFIRPGDRVVLKVNAAFASPPGLCATAHPDLVGEVARLCIAAGAASVVVTDNPINDPSSCFELSGIGPAARKAGAKVLLPTESAFRPMTLPGGRLIENWPVLAGPLAGADKLIGLGPVKHHERARASMSIKNWYGLLGGRRNTFHQDINGIIGELGRMARPTLVVLDGTQSMMTNGPTGGSLEDLKATRTMVVSTDHVAADAFGATLLEISAADLPYLRAAEQAGVGTTDWESLDPIRADVS
jgi:uncharacterized protein (DUF362 family)